MSVIRILYFPLGILCGIIIGIYIHHQYVYSNNNEIKYKYEGDISTSTDLSYNRDSMYAEGVDPYGVYNRQDGVIPNPQVAADYAEIILSSIFEGHVIVKQRPYSIKLLNKHVWSVSGMLPQGHEGGGFHLLIERSDGRILMIRHEK